MAPVPSKAPVFLFFLCFFGGACSQSFQHLGPPRSKGSCPASPRTVGRIASEISALTSNGFSQKSAVLLSGFETSRSREFSARNRGTKKNSWQRNPPEKAEVSKNVIGRNRSHGAFCWGRRLMWLSPTRPLRSQRCIQRTVHGVRGWRFPGQTTT